MSKRIKPLFILLLLISITASAEDCIFSEEVYTEFISTYAKENPHSRVDGDTLTVNKEKETITVQGGGCDHLGMSIESNSKQTYTETEFLQKTLALSIEFGDWLINTKALKSSVENGNYEIINGIYFIEVDMMTLFEASFENPGKIMIDFYIN